MAAGTRVPSMNKLLSYSMSTSLKDVALISSLLEHPRVDKNGNRVASALTKAKPTDPPEFIDVLMRSRNLDYGKLATEVIETLVQYNRDNLAPFNLELIYKEDDYGLLLREIILKRLDMEYYIKWLTKRIVNKECERSTTLILYQACSNFFSPETAVQTNLLVHDQREYTDPLHTAYTAFLLLAREDDLELILDIVQEQGASDEGIVLAGELVGTVLLAVADTQVRLLTSSQQEEP